VTLGEAIARIGSLPPEATLYVVGEPEEWDADSDTAVGVEDVESKTPALPPEADGRVYFLEVAVAREVLDGWKQNLERAPTVDEEVERVIYYARFDA
jgi:hypothetical protein